jgi:CheY-like chemotaxis protein
VDAITQAADRATNLTRQLLAFGRKQILQPAILNLNTLLMEMDQLLRVTMNDRIELVVRTEPELGKVKADRGQIEQVVTNLVLNARDAMPEGGTITVQTSNVNVDEAYSRAHRSVPPGEYVVLSVSDTGVGMDSETQAHLFEPFFTTKPKGLGVGLGLSTIYGIVRQSGGYIWAFSELGEGTTFQIYLPRVEAEEEAFSGDGQKAPRTVVGGSETILLVEDDPLVRRLARQVLEESGYSVVPAANGPEALQALKSHKDSIHLLLTDVVMPRMSGREVADRVVSQRPDAKVLFMSGHTEDAIVYHGVLEPGVAFLQKPFTPHGLLTKVRDVLDNSNK